MCQNCVALENRQILCQSADLMGVVQKMSKSSSGYRRIAMGFAQV
jgi:hypothetical protein